MTHDLLAQARQVLHQQPFSMLMGAEIEDYRQGYARMRLPLKPQHLQQHGFAHGGVISFLADTTLTAAGASVLGNCVTAEYKVNYVRPATKTNELIAESTVLSSGKTQAVCRCDVFMVREGERVLCATSLGTIRRIEA